MKQKYSHYIYVIFLLFSFEGFFAQNFSLKITSDKKTDVAILSKIAYQKKHKDTIRLKLEIEKISTHLKNDGYFLNTIDSIKKIKKEFVVYFSLHQKIEKAIINFDKSVKPFLKNIKNTNNSFSIPIKKLQSTLYTISKELDKKGKSFSKVRLTNININDDTLFADLEINESKKRIINTVIVKGYENFPISYLKNYFNIKSNSLFNQQKIKTISNLSKNLQFIEEIKPPEVLFTKDSTLLYIHLKKKQNNSIDGIVSFASKENGDLLFNGNIDLKLNNILNTGEKFKLFWNSIGDERQEFNISAEIPYIFNTKFSPQLSFNIYKQDSTFLNTKFDSKVFYSVNSKTKLAITYNSESSENLNEVLNTQIKTFSNYFLGVQFQYNVPKNDFFFNDTFNLEINPTFGKRKISESSTNQFKIEATISYLWDLDLRNSIFIKNNTVYLNSDTFIDNELFRIGGANSIRGFNEQSIFTNNYTYFNLEYRYLTSDTSYFYSITDIGSIKTVFEKETLLGIGLGYLFTTKNSQINLSTVIGKEASQKFDFKNSKLIISWKNYF